MSNVKNYESLSKQENDLRDFFKEMHYVIYPEEEDPEMKALELENINSLSRDLINLLDLISSKGICYPGTFRGQARGYYDYNPFPIWEGRRVKVRRLYPSGEGKIVAAREVGHWYMVGVEFDQEIPGGHSLQYKEQGRSGNPGHCSWVWSKDLVFIH